MFLPCLLFYTIIYLETVFLAPCITKSALTLAQLFETGEQAGILLPEVQERSFYVLLALGPKVQFSQLFFVCKYLLNFIVIQIVLIRSITRQPDSWDSRTH